MAFEPTKELITAQSRIQLGERLTKRYHSWFCFSVAPFPDIQCLRHQSEHMNMEYGPYCMGVGDSNTLVKV